ncbi:MAG: hypothetical protein KDE01_21895, partial [Caldilineaceae bacterium]|nr:hypothetical protein [Caldilineaceae bacterium]
MGAERLDLGCIFPSRILLSFRLFSCPMEVQDDGNCVDRLRVGDKLVGQSRKLGFTLGLLLARESHGGRDSADADAHSAEIGVARTPLPQPRLAAEGKDIIKGAFNDAGQLVEVGIVVAV